MTPSYTPSSPAGKSGDGLGQEVSRLFVATLVPVLGLFVLRVILSALPMIKNAGPIADLGVTPLLLIKAVLDSVIYFLVIRFTMAVSQRLKSLRPHLTEIATVVLLAGCALVATFAYTGYEVLFATLAPSQIETYNWIFLAVVLTPIAAIVVIVTRRLDFFTNLLYGKLNETMVQPQAFAAAAGNGQSYQQPIQPNGFPPAPMAAPPRPDPTSEMRQRLNAIEQKVASARSNAEGLRLRNSLHGELAESAIKMESYFDGAARSFEKEDLASAKHFADWADYEASRVLSAGN